MSELEKNHPFCWSKQHEEPNVTFDTDDVSGRLAVEDLCRERGHM